MLGAIRAPDEEDLEAVGASDEEEQARDEPDHTTGAQEATLGKFAQDSQGNGEVHCLHGKVRLPNIL